MKNRQYLYKLYGTWAVITGASSGIGREFAYELGKLGFNLFLVARRGERLLQIKTELETAYKIKVEFLTADLLKDDTIEHLFKKIENLDIGLIVNNAGTNYISKYEDLNNLEINNIIKLNVLVPLEITRKITPIFKKRKSSGIIFIGSVLGDNPVPYASLYSASKAFIDSFAQSIWSEFEVNNIDVLTIKPGSTKTEFERLSGDSIFTREPSHVVKSALKNIGAKVNVTDGIMNKIIKHLLKIIPYKIRLRTTYKMLNKKGISFE